MHRHGRRRDRRRWCALAAGLRPALGAEVEPESQRAARLEQDLERGVTAAVAGAGCAVGAAGLTAGAGDGAAAVGAGVGGAVGVAGDAAGLTAGFGGVGVEGVGVEEVASTFGGAAASALASSGCGSRAGWGGCGSGSLTYFACSARALARSLPPSTLCSFMSFSQASITGSVALRQCATASGSNVVIGSPRADDHVDDGRGLHVPHGAGDASPRAGRNCCR